MSLEADDITAITFEGINSEVLSGKIKAQIKSNGFMLAIAICGDFHF